MLTDEQEQLILTFWNESEVPPGLTDIVKVAFPTQELDGRSKEGREVKSFLAERNLRARPAQEYPAKPKVELTEDQKSYIDNHAVLMSALEIAKSLFDDNKLTNLHQETICVKEYVTETLPPVSSPGGVAAIGDYRAPKTMPAAISQINKYVTPGYDKECVTRQTKLLEALKGKRSERLKEQRGSGASVLNLFQLLKEENSRKKLVKIANMRKLIVKDTIDELSDMDEIKFRIFGLSKEEALNG